MKTILFDIDGTLAMSEPADGECFAEAFCNVFGGNAPNTTWSDYAHVTDWGILDQALGATRGRSTTHAERLAFEQAYRATWQRRFNAEPTACREVPGAAAMVAEILQHADWKCGVATGGTRGAATFKLAAVGIDANLLGGAYANGAIPRAAIVRNAMRAIGTQPQETVYIGDGRWDVVTCRALDIRFVGVAAECTTAELRGWGATQVVPDFNDQQAFWNAVAAATPPE